MFLLFAILFITGTSVFGSTLPPPPPEDNKILMQIEEVEKHYDHLKELEDKISRILKTVTVVDTNLKALQEKAHVWEIFRHHIESWNDYMKSLDHKVDIIKRSQDDNLSIDSKLNSLEFAINHVLTKVDQINEKGKELSPGLEEKLQDIHKIVNSHESAEVYGKREILNKLGGISRAISTLEKGNCRRSRGTRLSHTHIENDSSIDLLQDIQSRLEDLSEQVSGGAEIKELIVENKRNSELIEEILETVRAIDERTIRQYDAESRHNRELLSTCGTSFKGLTITFKEQSSVIMKQLETLITTAMDRLGNVNVNTPPRGYTERPIVRADRSPEGDGPVLVPVPVPVPDDDEQQKSDQDSSDEVHSEDASNEIDGEKTTWSPLYTSTTSRPSTTTLNPASTTPRLKKNLHYDFDEPTKNGCEELTVRRNGVYLFGSGGRSNLRYCSFVSPGPGWTVIQRRGEFDVQENFNRSWADYKEGFGDLHSEFWLGNDLIHKIVSDGKKYELNIQLEAFDDSKVWATYTHFSIENEKENYRLHVKGYEGTASDSLIYHNGMKFSTYDRDNDNSYSQCCPCAPTYGGGWWFNDCIESNLNGIFKDSPYGHNFVGIVWENWRGDYSLKSTEMLLRPYDVVLSPSSVGENSDEDDSTEIPDDP